jgi:hypothetical protein
VVCTVYGNSSVRACLGMRVRGVHVCVVCVCMRAWCACVRACACVRVRIAVQSCVSSLHSLPSLLLCCRRTGYAAHEADVAWLRDTDINPEIDRWFTRSESQTSQWLCERFEFSPFPWFGTSREHLL